MGELADSYRLSMFEIRVTRRSCALMGKEMAGNGCIMWSFLICSASQILGLAKNSAGWLSSVAFMGEKRIVNRILNTCRK